jgi:isocitrate dehydrogenase
MLRRTVSIARGGLLSRRAFKSTAPKRVSAVNEKIELSKASPTIIYTETDEAPNLATYSFLPVVKKMVSMAGINVVKSDISLAGRVISQFPEKMKEDQVLDDELQALGDLAKTPEANIIKLPNISASLPQLMECISELRAKGFDVPMYPSGDSAEDEEIKAKYAKVLGSAVNPVLREGNSDRRVAAPVKEYAQRNPHKMGIWSRACRTHVSHMSHGDFYASEQSFTATSATDMRIEFVPGSGEATVLKPVIPLMEGEVMDSSFLSTSALRDFLETEMQDAKDSDLLLSLHLKATMMKVSDPVIFGHAVTVFYKSAFEKNAKLFEELGVNPNNGIGDVYEKIESLPRDQRKKVERDLDECYKDRPWLAMVNSDKGITNLHVPSDVIVDASMPVVIRDSGQMWNKDDELEDTKCIIPDRNYATMYQEVVSFVKAKGQFDVSTMGNVSNVGLMAQKAEEYGSHDKTFVLPTDGTIKVIDNNTNEVKMEHSVQEGDIFRACQTKDVAIKDWVKLAVNRAKATGNPAIFWLDKDRAHDAKIIEKVNLYLKDHDTTGLDLSIKNPVDAVRTSMDRAIAGKDTISVTGNVLRDYLTDLFPILELGTSAKMLSVVPLLAGGGMFETGAGGSAPKHVQQFVEEGHLRWDSLGEYLAMAVSLEHMGETTGNERAKKLASSLNNAIGRLLQNRKSPGRKVNQLDNRASNFYVGLYWAEFMAMEDAEYKELAETLKDNRVKIVEELKSCQGEAQDIGGYYKLDPVKAEMVMRPSPTWNKIID